MPKKANKINTKNPADTMANPVLVKAGDDKNPSAVAKQADEALTAFLNNESETDRINRLVAEGVAVQMAATAQDAASDPFYAIEHPANEVFIAGLSNLVHNLALEFDIDIEQVDPGAIPVKYAQKSLLRDLCYLSKRAVDYNKTMAVTKSKQLTQMANRHDGSDLFDEKLQNVQVFARGVEMQLELWECFHEACLEQHLVLVGFDWAKGETAGNPNAPVTAAAMEARKFASRHLDESSEGEIAENEKIADKDEIERLRRQIDVLSRD